MGSTHERLEELTTVEERRKEAKRLAKTTWWCWHCRLRNPNEDVTCSNCGRHR